MPGVVKVVREGSYLAVVAEREWQAIKAMRALAAAAHWRETARRCRTRRRCRRDPGAAGARHPGLDLDRLRRARRCKRHHGALHAALSDAWRRSGRPAPWRSSTDGGMTVWTHTQGVFPLRAALAELLRLPPEQVRCIHVEGSGCYGHNGADDVAGDAALIARALPGRPIRVQWMREQEHTSEPYGPAMVAEVSGGARRRRARSSTGTTAVWSNTHNRRPNVGGLMLQNAALPDPLPVPPPGADPDAGGRRRPQQQSDLCLAERAGGLAFRSRDAAAGFGAALAGRLSERVRHRELHGRAGGGGGGRPGRVPAAPLRTSARAAVVATAAEQFGWAKRPPRSRGEGRGFAFARYKNLGAYCAVALELRVEHETGRIRSGGWSRRWIAGSRSTPTGSATRSRARSCSRRAGRCTRRCSFDRQRHHQHAIGAATRSCASRPCRTSIEVHIMRSAGPAVPGHRRGRAGADGGGDRQCGAGCDGRAAARFAADCGAGKGAIGV